MKSNYVLDTVALFEELTQKSNTTSISINRKALQLPSVSQHSRSGSKSPSRVETTTTTPPPAPVVRRQCYKTYLLLSEPPMPQPTCSPSSPYRSPRNLSHRPASPVLSPTTGVDSFSSIDWATASLTPTTPATRGARTVRPPLDGSMSWRSLSLSPLCESSSSFSRDKIATQQHRSSPQSRVERMFASWYNDNDDDDDDDDDDDSDDDDSDDDDSDEDASEGSNGPRNDGDSTDDNNHGPEVVVIPRPISMVGERSVAASGSRAAHTWASWYRDEDEDEDEEKGGSDSDTDEELSS